MAPSDGTNKINVGSLFKRICSNWKINLQVHSILEKILYRTKEKIKTSKHSKKAGCGRCRWTGAPGQAATIGLMLPAEVSAKKLYLELRDAATDLVLHKSPDLPVDLIG